MTVTTTDQVFELRSYDKTASRNKSICLKLAKLNQKVCEIMKYRILALLSVLLLLFDCDRFMYVLQPNESSSAPATVRASNAKDEDDDISFFQLMRGNSSPRPGQVDVPPVVTIYSESKRGSPLANAAVS